MNKQQKSVISVYIIVLLLYNVLFFIIPFPKSASTWTTYAFTIPAFLISFGITAYAFKAGKTLRSRLYGYPIFHIGMLYLLCQAIFSIIISFIGCFFTLPIWLPVVFSILLLGLTLIGVIATDNTRDIIETQETAVRESIKNISYFKLDMESIADTCEDTALKKKLNALSEKLKYSDPVSEEHLESIENQIVAEIRALADLVNTDLAAAEEKINYVTQLLETRNRRCKAFKH